MTMNVSRSSLKHQIADAVRKTIFRGELSPGDKITEAKLAEDLDVSRGPVREAIQLLVMDGLLVSTTYRETRVSYITTEEVMELLIPMRINMETYALRKASSLWDQRHFDEFEKILEEMRRAALLEDIPYFNEQDIKFHELIIRSSNLNNVKNLWNGISNRIQLHFIYQNQLDNDMEQFVKDHRKLFEIFKAGDIEKSVQSLKDHIIETNTPQAELLPDQPDV